MPVDVHFDNVLLSEDGGQQVIELVITADELYKLIRSEVLRVGNIRPDNEIVVKRGREDFAKSSQRLQMWAEEYRRNKGVSGNLTWNINPDTCEYTLEINPETGNWRLSLISGQIKTPDSATRHRAFMEAWESIPRTMRADYKFSVRCWFVRSANEGPVEPGELTAEAVFDSYQNYGKPVPQSVARYHYQRDGLEHVIGELVKRSPHLGIENVEVKSNTVSKNSNKLVAYNTLVKAFEKVWSEDVDTEELQENVIEWLLLWWDALVSVRPELGYLPLSARKRARDGSMSATATAFHGYIALANRMRSDQLPMNTLEGLNQTITLDIDRPRHRAGDIIDILDMDNPEWEKRGILVPTLTNLGETKLNPRSSFQARDETRKYMMEICGVRPQRIVTP